MLNHPYALGLNAKEICIANTREIGGLRSDEAMITPSENRSADFNGEPT